MPYGPVKFRLTVVKPYNHDLDNDPAADDPEDIVYAEGPARPGRLEVRIPAAAAPPAAMIPIAEILSPTPDRLPIAEILSSPTPNPARIPALRLVLLLLSLVRVVSDVMINED